MLTNNPPNKSRRRKEGRGGKEEEGKGKQEIAGESIKHR
jgi:hypothetical protein